MSRCESTDFERHMIKPLLPNKPPGVPHVDDRRVLNGILWVPRSGAAWRALPEPYGQRTTCYNRFVHWHKVGVQNRLMDAITAGHDDDTQIIDAPPLAPTVRPRRQNEGADHSLGRPRGGLTTILHVAVDAHGLPIWPGLTAGQKTHDGQIADRLRDYLGPRNNSRAGKACDSDHARKQIPDQGATPNAAPKSN